MILFFFSVFASYRYIFISFFLLQYTCTYKFTLAFSLPSPLLLRIESCIPTLTKWVSTIVRGHARSCWTTRTPIYAVRSQAAMTVREFHLKRCVYVCVQSLDIKSLATRFFVSFCFVSIFVLVWYKFYIQFVCSY